MRVPSASVVGNISIPGRYLHGAFKVQSGSTGDDVCIADSGPSCYMTHDGTRLYKLRLPPPGRKIITIGERQKVNVRVYREYGCDFRRGY